MNIEEAKKTLENQVIFWEGVNGVGIIKDAGNDIIEIAIEESNDQILQKINDLLPKMQWQGCNVKIVTTNNFKFQ